MKFLYFYSIYFIILFFYGANGVKDIGTSQTYEKKTVGKFWQLTDIHWDLDYSETGDVRNMCHESSEGSKNSTGHFGNYYCDAPYALVRSALIAMKNIEPNPDFIVWTGDNSPHTREVDFSVIFKILTNITTELKSLFNSNIPIIPVLGNHDTFPSNNYPASLEAFYSEYLSKGNWKSVIPEEEQENFKRGGYYKVQINSDLDVVVINTNLYYKNNKLGEGLKDPGSQFKWLRDVFGKAKSMNKKVLITAHAPPGYWERLPRIPFLNETYNDEFVDLLNDFGENIIGQIYGHEHTDSFRIFGHSHDDLTSVGFLAPSLTPWHPYGVTTANGINPSVRLYMFSQNSITDYLQYHMNLTEANKANLINSCSIEMAKDHQCNDVSLHLWEEYYQATKAYGVNSIDVTGLTEAFSKLSKNDTYFQAYFLRNTAGFQSGYCNESCKLDHLCAISHLKIASLINCLKSSHENNSSSVFNLFNAMYDTSGMEIITIISVAIFFALSLGVVILVIVLHCRSRKSSNKGSVEHTVMYGNRGNRDGYRPLSTEAD